MQPLSFKKKPEHIAIIMDGNGRWAQRRGKNRSYGHKNAKQAVEEAITGCLEQEIPYLTLYAFSTENWRRPQKEVESIFRVIAYGIRENIHRFMEHNIKFRVVGDRSNIPDFCLDPLQEAIEITKYNNRLHLTIAVNYGGQAEAVAASEAMVNDFLSKIVTEFLASDHQSCPNHFINFIRGYQAKITPSIYKEYLYTKELPSVDLLIRTGGKTRMSNFLPWQCAYAELYFTDLFWPIFKKEDLLEALAYFQRQHRTFGGVGAIYP